MRSARSTNSSIVSGFVCLAALATMGLASGCNSAQQQQRNEIVLDPTPELGTLQSREVDVTNTTTVVFDTNWRSFRSDVGRLFLTDRPSRLTPEPVR
jgi:hypothetical protein